MPHVAVSLQVFQKMFRRADRVKIKLGTWLLSSVASAFRSHSTHVRYVPYRLQEATCEACDKGRILTDWTEAANGCKKCETSMVQDPAVSLRSSRAPYIRSDVI